MPLPDTLVVTLRLSLILSLSKDEHAQGNHELVLRQAQDER
jgi:hypothetical protein